MYSCVAELGAEVRRCETQSCRVLSGRASGLAEFKQQRPQYGPVKNLLRHLELCSIGGSFFVYVKKRTLLLIITNGLLRELFSVVSFLACSFVVSGCVYHGYLHGARWPSSLELLTFALWGRGKAVRTPEPPRDIRKGIWSCQTQTTTLIWTMEKAVKT